MYHYDTIDAFTLHDREDRCRPGQVTVTQLLVAQINPRSPLHHSICASAFTSHSMLANP